MQEECDCSALPGLGGEGWGTAWLTAEEYVIAEVCFDTAIIIHCTEICHINPSGGFWEIFARPVK